MTATELNPALKRSAPRVDRSDAETGTASMDKPCPRFIRWFDDIGIEDIPLVGGKNASLGEMYRELTPRGIRVPEGFAITAEACSTLRSS